VDSARPTGWSRVWRDLREVTATVLVALAIAVVVKTFLVQPFFIPSESMESTLLVGDRVLVSKLEPGPGTLERGDVVVFVDPGGWLPPRDSEPPAYERVLTFVGLLPANSGEHLIKRVVGLAGDTVECCDDEGRMMVNGVPVDEPYLFEGDVPSTIDFTVEVPDGRLWVQGDHRSVSEDSRYQVGQPGGGMVPLDNVVGRAVLVMWPFERFSTLPTPERVFDGVGGLDGVS
jgi:signal peptidase I